MSTNVQALTDQQRALFKRTFGHRDRAARAYAAYTTTRRRESAQTEATRDMLRLEHEALRGLSARLLARLKKDT